MAKKKNVNYRDIITGRSYGNTMPKGFVVVNGLEDLNDAQLDRYRSYHPTELPEVTVVGKSDKESVEEPEFSYNGRSYVPTDANMRYFSKVASKDSHVREGWGQKQWGKLYGGALATGAAIAAPFLIPEVAGALNLYGAYTGGKRLFSDEGIKKTWNHVLNSEYLDAAKSAGGDVLDIAMVLPFLNTVRRGANWLYDTGRGEALNFADRYFFMPHKYSYTRGIGRGTEGLSDLMTTGIVRGNPRGTEVTAASFAKLYRRNRDHFRDIMKSTGIPNIENKFFSRNLTEEEFNAIKEASKGYEKRQMSTKLEEIYVPADPLSYYPTYSDYINDINETVREVELMPSRIQSGEVKVDPTFTMSEESSIPIGRPIEERFGPNSDYIGDGTPLAYFYSDGRNPITKGYDYAGSDYGVRVNNLETYTPFLHELHYHPSFFNAPKLSDPNVELFGKGPLGLTLKLDKTTGKPLLYQEPLDFFKKFFGYPLQ